MKRIGKTAMSALAAAALLAASGLNGLGLSRAPAAEAVAFPSPFGQSQVSGPRTADLVAQTGGSPLTRGCNLVVLSNLTSGMKVADYIMQNVKPADAVVGVWHFDNTSQHYQAFYLGAPDVPVDQSTFTSASDAFFICVSADASGP
ncbi:MAG: hypothetical protein ACR2PL_26725 [Dehalococcoidia bacterium]